MRLIFNHVALVLILSLVGKIALSQENFASNVSKSISDDGKLLITYDITSAEDIKSFSVVLLLTYEGKQVKASTAYGDIGPNISPGKEKAIVWYYEDDFEGDIKNVNVDIFAYKENEPRAVFQIASLGNKGYAPCKVDFVNSSSFANEYQWNFGDPSSVGENISFEKDPSHIYKKGGIYSIALTARNTRLNLENTYYQSIEIKTHDPVIADFKIEGNNQMPPAKVDFVNSSVNADTYQWNFGDPSSGSRKNESDKENPKYKYKNPGTYNVRLIVRNNFSGLSDTVTKDVIVGQQQIAEAKYIYTMSSETAPSTVVFKNTSVNASRFEWDFDDPDSGSKNSSEEADPAHLYSSPGNYEVELSAWAEGQKKPVRYKEVITISELPKPPDAVFSIKNNNVLGPATIIFENNSVNAEKYEWDFGDPDSGSENISGKTNPVHTYKKAGRYKVVLTASRQGFTKESTAIDYVVIKGSTEPAVRPTAGFNEETDKLTAPAISPVAEFTVRNNNATAPAKVLFSNSSVNATGYSWNFGDPASGNLNSSAEKEPEHIYEKAGQYTVTLEVANEESGQKSTSERTVVVGKPPEPPVAEFEVILENDNVPVNAGFKNLSVNADAYKWNFGDFDSENNESSEVAPTHYYKVPGNYIITLEAVNSPTGERHKVTKEIKLVSSYSTFVQSDDLRGNPENAYSAVSLNEDYLIITGYRGRESEILKINNSGKVIKSEKLEYQAYNIVPLSSGEEFMIVGINKEGKMLVQLLGSSLKKGDHVIFMQNKNYATDLASPKIAFGRTNEIGVVANMLNDRYPVDIMFQKTDNRGRIIPLVDRTFKYVGKKMATDIIPTGDGGFALTGYWQENENSSMMILFGKIDRRGHGEMKLISSEMNILGCDIKESYQGGYAVLRAKENVENRDIYEISFILISSDGGPTECANMLPCPVKKEDIFKYKPSMIKIEDGYVVASHAYNGVDYDISLFWIDQTGEVLIKYENITMEGDQFVMDLIRASDGGYLITGTQKKNNKQQAIILKTDPFGKLN
jgi:PKD repeat protein